jgi:hypothetical protein
VVTLDTRFFSMHSSSFKCPLGLEGQVVTASTVYNYRVSQK